MPLVVWMGFHIWLSALHSVTLLLMHAAIFSVVGYLMFRPTSAAFFRTQAADVAR